MVIPYADSALIVALMLLEFSEAIQQQPEQDQELIASILSRSPQQALPALRRIGYKVRPLRMIDL